MSAEGVPRLFEITEVQIRRVEDGRDGLLAWVSCVIGRAIFVNCIALRRGRDGTLFLTYPARRTSHGKRHYYWNPLTCEASQALQRAVMSAIRELGIGAVGQAASGGESR